MVRYLQLAHNERHAVTGTTTAKVIHNFGRAEKVDRDALARLVSSISRFLTPEQLTSGVGGGDNSDDGGGSGGVEVLDSRRLGGVWTLDRVWERIGIGAAIRRVATRRRLDGDFVERVVFALVAQRALEPGSKLAATGWVGERVVVDNLTGFSDDQAYRAMDFLLDALEEIAAEIFGSVAHLLNLDCDLLLVDTSSTYWHTECADGYDTLPELVDDNDVARPQEQAKREFGHSKDHRRDLPQVVIAMAVTREGIPIRCWTFPGSTADTTIIRTVRDDLAGWNLVRTLWVADRGFASETNRAYLTGDGGHYVHAEKLRHTNRAAAAALADTGPFQPVTDSLSVKDVTIEPPTRTSKSTSKGEGDGQGVGQRFVVCHNPDEGQRDAAVRANLIEHLQTLIGGSDAWSAQRRDEFVGSLKGKPGLRRFLHRNDDGLLRINNDAIASEERLDGIWLLRTSDTTLPAAELAAAYKQLLHVERGWRDMKSSLDLRPVFHYRQDRIRSHIQLCWLALLLIRVVENATGDTWRNARHELDRMHLVTLATNDGQVSQRTTLTHGQKTILTALDLPEPPRFFDFTTPSA